ncbi:MAG TPA: RNA-dependent DNA polymerase, partial [Clostridiales bacterium]|nr:RNA-dependent DNA polymerase [Clostridiales bacterium]
MAILHHDKQYLWEIKREVEGFLANRLHLDLNSKTTVRSVSQGVEWLGHRVWPTHIRLRKSTAQKMRKRLRYLQKACGQGEATPADLNTTWQSYRGMLKHCNSYRLQRKLEGEMGDMQD